MLLSKLLLQGLLLLLLNGLLVNKLLLYGLLDGLLYIMLRGCRHALLHSWLLREALRRQRRRLLLPVLLRR